MNTRDSLVKKIEGLGQTTLNRWIEQNSVNHHLQPEYLHWLVPLLQTMVNMFSSVTILLAHDRVNEAGPLMRIIMESWTNLFFVMENKTPDEVWSRYFVEFVLDTEIEGQITAFVNDVTYADVLAAHPHFQLWYDKKNDPRVQKLLAARAEKKRLEKPIGAMMDTIRLIAAGNGPLTDSHQSDVARHLAKRQLANKALRVLEWRSISAGQKEKAVFKKLKPDPADTPAEASKKRVKAKGQHAAMRFAYNAHIHGSGTVMATLLTRNPNENGKIEIGPSENKQRNLLTWRYGGELVLGAIFDVIQHFSLGSDLSDEATKVLDDLKAVKG